MISDLIGSHLILNTTSINIAELFFGAYLSERLDENTKAIYNLISKLNVISFTASHGKIYGQIRADLQKRGTLINELDKFIAYIAIESEQTLITRNIKHYEKINQVQIETW